MLFLSLMACQNKEQEKGDTAEVSRVKFKTETLKLSSRPQELKYSGTLEAWKTFPLSFQRSGNVEAIYVEEGDAVKKNQLLASLDPKDAEQTLAMATAKRKQAEDAYGRMKQLYDRGSLAEIKWVDIKTKLNQARSAESLAKSNLKKSKLYSPVQGFVGQRKIEVGMSGLKLEAPFQIVQIKKILVKVAVPENEIGRIRKNQVARIVVGALNDKCFKAKVKYIGIVANQFSRTYAVKLEVNNPDFALKPGMVCDVTINTGQESEALTLPFKAVSTNEKGEPFVYLWLGNKAVMQLVSLGNYRGNRIEILKGVKPGDCVILDGKEKLLGNDLVDYSLND